MKKINLFVFSGGERGKEGKQLWKKKKSLEMKKKLIGKACVFVCGKERERIGKERERERERGSENNLLKEKKKLKQYIRK